ncbi:MAG: SGNH/GDSL hydrolase family protein [Planctomycetaceae bacterium]
MKLRLAVTCSLVLGLAVMNMGTTAQGQEETKLPRVLILGDSISIGYTPTVQELLKDEAVVLRPMSKDGEKNENCQGTNNGVEHIDRWLKIDGGNWDVIHFNFGLHDLKRVNFKTGKNSNDSDDPHQADPETYGKQLEEIVGKLQATGAKLIFATTTPVPPGILKPHRDTEDPILYNAIALKIMEKHGVAIDDLYAFAEPRLDEIQRPVNVHFTPEGSEALGKVVAEKIRETLKNTAE